MIETINREVEGVVDVEVEWTGSDLQNVGEHTIQCKATRLAWRLLFRVQRMCLWTIETTGREVSSQCLLTTLDTNECMLPPHHRMRHQCHISAICVNTNGSYECLCPRLGETESIPETATESFWDVLESQTRGAWEVSFADPSRTSCPSKASTHGCCPSLLTRGDAASCPAAFRCPVDPCTSKHTCVLSAICLRAVSPMDMRTTHADALRG